MALNTKELTAVGSNGKHRFTLNVNETEISTATNKSKGNFTFKLSPEKTSWNWSNWGSQISYKITIGTQTFTGTIPSYDGTSTVTLKSGNFEIKHNDDGSKTINISFSITDTTGKNYTPGSVSKSGTMKLTDIQRESNVSCSSPYIGDTAIITVDKKNENFTSTIWCNIGSLLNIPIATKSKEKVFSLNTSEIADDIYSDMPNSKEINGIVVCETYNGNTKIGTSINDFNLYAKESVCKPDVDATIIDTNEKTIAITGDTSKFIKYVSKPKVTITANAKKSSTIKKYYINLNDGQTSDSQECIFNTIGSNNITIGVTDSRGYSNTKNIDISEKMIDYIKLHINNIELERTEQVSNEVILNANGVWFNGNFNEENNNVLTAKFQYKKTSENEWSEENIITPTIDNNTFKFIDVSLGNLFSYDDEYQFKIIINDKVMVVGSENKDIITVPKGQEIIAIGENGIWVDGFVKIFNNPIIESGSNDNGEYVKFYDGTMICRGIVRLTSNEQKTSGGLTYYCADTYINFPFEFSNMDVQKIQMTSEVRHENMNYICNTYAVPQSKTQARISLQTTQKNYERGIMWTAIGRWKQ